MMFTQEKTAIVLAAKIPLKIGRGVFGGFFILSNYDRTDKIKSKSNVQHY